MIPRSRPSRGGETDGANGKRTQAYGKSDAAQIPLTTAAFRMEVNHTFCVPEPAVDFWRGGHCSLDGDRTVK